MDHLIQTLKRESARRGPAWVGYKRLAGEIADATGRPFASQTIWQLIEKNSKPSYQTLVRLKQFFGQRLNLNKIA